MISNSLISHCTLLIGGNLQILRCKQLLHSNWKNDTCTNHLKHFKWFTTHELYRNLMHKLNNSSHWMKAIAVFKLQYNRIEVSGTTETMHLMAIKLGQMITNTRPLSIPFETNLLQLAFFSRWFITSFNSFVVKCFQKTNEKCLEMKNKNTKSKNMDNEKCCEWISIGYGLFWVAFCFHFEQLFFY